MASAKTRPSRTGRRRAVVDKIDADATSDRQQTYAPSGASPSAAGRWRRSRTIPNPEPPFSDARRAQHRGHASAERPLEPVEPGSPPPADQTGSDRVPASVIEGVEPREPASRRQPSSAAAAPSAASRFRDPPASAACDGTRGDGHQPTASAHAAARVAPPTRRAPLPHRGTGVVPQQRRPQDLAVQHRGRTMRAAPADGDGRHAVQSAGPVRACASAPSMRGATRSGAGAARPSRRGAGSASWPHDLQGGGGWVDDSTPATASSARPPSGTGRCPTPVRRRSTPAPRAAASRCRVPERRVVVRRPSWSRRTPELGVASSATRAAASARPTPGGPEGGRPLLQQRMRFGPVEAQTRRCPRSAAACSRSGGGRVAAPPGRAARQQATVEKALSSRRARTTVLVDFGPCCPFSRCGKSLACQIACRMPCV